MQGKSSVSWCSCTIFWFIRLRKIFKYTHTQSILFGHSAGQHCSWELCLSSSIPAAGSALLKQLWHPYKPSTNSETLTSQERLLGKLNPCSSFVTGFLPSWCPLRDKLAAENAGGTGAGVSVCSELLAIAPKDFFLSNHHNSHCHWKMKSCYRKNGSTSFWCFIGTSPCRGWGW